MLRVIKRMGRLIGPDGRATGVVPINIWDDALCDADALGPGWSRRAVVAYY